MSTLITHHPAESPDHDPTGVRDLLSSLPQPAPMPHSLVERINASLADEQARRAATQPLSSGASAVSGASVTPLLTRRRPGRIVFAVAGAAAALVVFAAVGNIFQTSRPASVTSSAAGSVAPSEGTPDGQALTGAEFKSAPQDAGAGAGAAATAAPLVRIRQSATRYTQDSFVTQARGLGSTAIDQIHPPAAEPDGRVAAGPMGTAPGLIGCLNAIGAGTAQIVRADLAFYEGRPAVIIVTTSNDTKTAYAVGRQCSPADATVLHPATPLP